MTKNVKDTFEDLGKQAGKCLDGYISNKAENKVEEFGKTIGKSVGEQVVRAQRSLEEEKVTKEEQLGIGGKIGTGIGVVGKLLVEKKIGLFCRLPGVDDLIANSRATGAKVEKIVKRAVKEKLDKLESDQKNKEK